MASEALVKARVLVGYPCPSVRRSNREHLCSSNKEVDMKKEYAAPSLVVRGTIETITQGDGLGIKDFFVFGTNDAIGRCKNNSCVVSS